MLETIQNVLIDIGNFFTSVVDFITGFFEDLVGFVKQLGSLATQFTDIMSGSFPAYFIAGVLSLVAIMVLLRVLGRD